MSEAEKLYDASLDAGQNPPVAIDVLFVLAMVIVHTVYLLKFTTFSLSYLEARILEKKESKKHYKESLRYWRAVWEWRSRVFDDDDHSMDDWDAQRICEEVNGTVWRQLAVLRWVLRLGMGISGLMLYILFLVTNFNIIYGTHSVSAFSLSLSMCNN